MQKASGIGATKQGEYIITDTGSASPISAAYAQLPMGRIAKLFEFGFEGDGKLVCPNYLTIDQHGRILVSDCVQRDVKVFDRVGKFLHKFGGDEGQSCIPQVNTAHVMSE